MTEKIKARCPGCEKVLGVPQAHRGRKISCPRCSTTFRVGGEKPASPSRPKKKKRSPSAPESPITPKAAPKSSRKSTGKTGSRGPTLPSRKRNKRQKRKKHGQLNEADQKTQSTGVMLLLIPVAATGLPLFGLQLRLLAAAGEFAPLIAMIFGILGAGCIGYARRNRADGIPVSCAAAVLAIAVGLGGFFLQRGSSEPVSIATGTHAPGATDAGNEAARQKQREAVSRMTEDALPGFRRNIERANPNEEPDGPMDLPLAGPRRRQPGDSLTNHSDTPQFPPNKSRTGEPAATGTETETKPKNNVTHSAPNGVSTNSSPNVDSKQTNLDSARTTGPDKNPLKPELRSSAQSTTMDQHRLNATWIRASGTFMKARRDQTILEGCQLTETIGQQQFSGKLFVEDSPLLGAVVFELSGTQIVPFDPGQPRSSNVIAATDSNSALAGFNLAFQSDSIVGFRGVFAEHRNGSLDMSKLTYGDWVGTKTGDTRDAISRGAPVCGFACFMKGFRITGFALVVGRKSGQTSTKDSRTQSSTVRQTKPVGKFATRPAKKTKEAMSAPVLWIEAEDPAMGNAIKSAQTSFLEFARLADLEHHRVVPVHDEVAIKAFFPDPAHPGRGEHIFLTDVSTDGKTVTATLNTSPNFKSELEEGDETTFPISNVSDWFLVTHGKGIGGFTIDVMWDQFPEEQRGLYQNSPPIVWYRERLLANRTAQMELDAVPVCRKCGHQELHTRSYKGATCGICANGGARVDCNECGAPIIRFKDQPHKCHRCQPKANDN